MSKHMNTFENTVTESVFFKRIRTVWSKAGIATFASLSLSIGEILWKLIILFLFLFTSIFSSFFWTLTKNISQLQSWCFKQMVWSWHALHVIFCPSKSWCSLLFYVHDWWSDRFFLKKKIDWFLCSLPSIVDTICFASQMCFQESVRSGQWKKTVDLSEGSQAILRHRVNI